MEKPKRVIRTLSELPPEATLIRLVHVLPGVQVTDKQLARFLGNSSIQHLIQRTEAVDTAEIRGVVLSPRKPLPPRRQMHLHSQESIRAISPRLPMPILRQEKQKKQSQLHPSPLRVPSIQSTEQYRSLMTSHLHVPAHCVMQPLSRTGKSHSPVPAVWRSLSPYTHCKKSTLS